MGLNFELRTFGGLVGIGEGPRYRPFQIWDPPQAGTKAKKYNEKKNVVVLYV